MAAKVRVMLEAAEGRLAAASATFEFALDAAASVGYRFAHGSIAVAYGATLRRFGQRRAAIKRIALRSAVRKGGAAAVLSTAAVGHRDDGVAHRGKVCGNVEIWLL